MKSLSALTLLAMSLPLAAENIDNARNQEIGTSATVEGYVTVASGQFTGFSYDQGFAIQDEEAGIYISVGTNPALQLNQKVRVSGTLNSSFNQTVLFADVADIEVLSGAKNIAATDINTGAVNDDSEGTLVNIKGTVTYGPIDDLPYGWSFKVDDGSGPVAVFIASTVNMNPFEIPWLQVGQSVSVTGLSSEFADHFEVNPRRRGDLVKVGN
jgi:hypothetical protein